LNPHLAQPISPVAMANSLWRHRELILQMTRREVLGRYKGSAMGLLWSFFNPVLMLTVYTFVFSVVFNARWSSGSESRIQFALVLFTGLIVHTLFADVLNRAPSLVLSNINFVKKVIFPLEILPIIAIGAALFHALISISVLLGAHLLFNGYLHWTILFLPFVLIPILILILGVAWILASLGVYLRDVGQLVGIFTSILLFLSPIFYPISALPEFLRPWMLINPLTFIIEQMRSVLIAGQPPNWQGLSLYLFGSMTFTSIGYFWFQKTRKGFADVL
jgi:lipopolysaccharide transport system permease protein